MTCVSMYILLTKIIILLFELFKRRPKYRATTIRIKCLL